VRQHHRDEGARKKEDTHYLKERTQLSLEEAECPEVLTCQAGASPETDKKPQAE
jgi:hypothetical protein